MSRDELSTLSLSEKWRPRILPDMVGNDHERSVIDGMLKSKKIRRAILITGGYGSGKTTLARILARTLNCQKTGPVSACGECASCRSSLESHPDVTEIDAASDNGVDAARSLKRRQAARPTLGRFRVFVIDECHRMTAAAWGSMLKVVEEPAAHSIFIFVTTEKGLVPDTIKSRCLEIDLMLVETKFVVRYLKRVNRGEKMGLPKSVLLPIARASRGHVRDALSMMEKVWYSTQAFPDEKARSRALPELVRSVVQQAPYHIVENYLKAVLSGRASHAMDSLSTVTENEYFLKAILNNMMQLGYFVCNPNLCDSWSRSIFSGLDPQPSKSAVARAMTVTAERAEMLKRYLVPSDMVLSTLTMELLQIFSKKSESR